MKIVQNDDMPSAMIVDGTSQLRFTGEGERLLCEVEDSLGTGDLCQLKCRLSSLGNVLGGLRYHFAGENALCTIYKQDEGVVFDLQISSRPATRIAISEEKYSEMLTQLQL